MSPVVRIPDKLYERLGKHAQGFDTPASVIEKLLDCYEKNCAESPDTEQDPIPTPIATPISLKIIYHPEGQMPFKKALLQKKQAYIRLYKTNGTSEVKVWNASRFTEDSDVNANLRSGYLRGWKSKGICKAVIAIDKADLS